jgi:hypothetical protein
MSCSGIVGTWAVGHAVAGFPYFAVASALCLRHQQRVPPSRRLPTETTWHPSPSGIEIVLVPKSVYCAMPIASNWAICLVPNRPATLTGEVPRLCRMSHNASRVSYRPLAISGGVSKRDEVRAPYVILDALVERVVIIKLELLTVCADDNVAC